jgi:hypothetical protein
LVQIRRWKWMKGVYKTECELDDKFQNSLCTKFTSKHPTHYFFFFNNNYTSDVYQRAIMKRINLRFVLHSTPLRFFLYTITISVNKNVIFGFGLPESGKKYWKKKNQRVAFLHFFSFSVWLLCLNFNASFNYSVPSIYALICMRSYLCVSQKVDYQQGWRRLVEMIL